MSNKVKYPIGKRVIIRTRTSGVSIGILKEVNVKNGMSVRLKNGVRIWSWTGAFTLSEMATTGANCRVDRHPKSINIEAPEGGEILPVSDSAWDYIEANWTEGSK